MVTNNSELEEKLADVIAYEEHFGEYGEPDFEDITWTIEGHGWESCDSVDTKKLKTYIIKAIKLATTTKDQEITQLKGEVERLDSALEIAINALEDTWGLFHDNAHDRRGQHAGYPRILNPRNCTGYRDRVRAHITELQQARTLTNLTRKDS